MGLKYVTIIRVRSKSTKLLGHFIPGQAAAWISLLSSIFEVFETYLKVNPIWCFPVLSFSLGKFYSTQDRKRWTKSTFRSWKDFHYCSLFFLVENKWHYWLAFKVVLPCSAYKLTSTLPNNTLVLETHFSVSLPPGI